MSSMKYPQIHKARALDDTTLGLCQVPQHWQFSSLHRLIAAGVYAPDWGMDGKSVEPPSWGAGE